MTDHIISYRREVEPAVFAGWPFGAVILAAALALQIRGELNCDDSWFITFAAHVFAGATAYVDISDPNTPAAFLIYMPAVALAWLTGLRTEALVVCEVVGLVAVCLSLAIKVLRDGGRMASSETGAFRNAALFAFLLLPGGMFAEREHFAAILALPMIATAAVRSNGTGVRWPRAAAAGLAGGMVVAIKPHFVLVLALPMAFAMMRRRSLWPALGAESFFAAATMLAYLSAIAVCFPAYFSIALPEGLAFYVPARLDLASCIQKPITLFLVLLYALYMPLRRTRGRDSRADALMLASLGFFICYLVQGKMSPNHGMPAITIAILGLLVCLIAKPQRPIAPGDRIWARALVPIVVVAPLFTFAQVDLLQMEPYPGLRAAVTEVAKSHAKIAAMTEIIDMPFPIVRQVDGIWIGRQNALWRANNVEWLLASTHPDEAQRRALEAIADRDRAELAADIAAGKPDIVLVENAEVRGRELAHPAFAHVLDGYRLTAQASGVEIWTRVDASVVGAR